MKTTSAFVLFLVSFLMHGQSNNDITNDSFKNILLMHKEFVSIPNLPENKSLMLQNINWVKKEYNDLGFNTTSLESSTLPILIAEKKYDPTYETVLFYFHIDGQPINPESWNQKNPFDPVLKEKNENGVWNQIDWKNLNNEINDEWRIFARAAADDKAPIIMLLSALKILKDKGVKPNINIKVIFDPEEEYGSKALLSTLEKYKERYASDYFIVMDGPAHNSNKPTVTFGCRGITTCSITTYGSKLPQHSGHYGNYVPNPVFSLANLLSSMKDEQGKVLIEDYYKGIEISPEIYKLLESVPFNSKKLNKNLGIYASEKVGNNYQESLQYPSLNVRQIGTSWKGKGLKTVIPEYATANLDIRLVPETDGKVQLQKVKKHIQQQGYYVIDRDPTDEERRSHPKIVKFIASRSLNAFRTNPDSDFGKKIRAQLMEKFGEEPVVIRLMGGTVPIVPVINKLKVPTVIIPMVNMDNNQHSPNENIRIGNIRQGINICLTILNSKH
ncbi:M20/M25/M40 family metallo-hydrolase [uncultured Aquimarina sp.]|uniref:M20/M25/M40 family metallo-hydrolase n=1 Tax=uncultured Aquimarina sp. TaxID=575652 RepID=UPI00260419CB|nr:M20/M25/M40 family metallo-hydrolase [uncultured Aquimarina sp.]